MNEPYRLRCPSCIARPLSTLRYPPAFCRLPVHNALLVHEAAPQAGTTLYALWREGLHKTMPSAEYAQADRGTGMTAPRTCALPSCGLPNERRSSAYCSRSCSEVARRQKLGTLRKNEPDAPQHTANKDAVTKTAKWSRADGLPYRNHTPGYEARRAAIVAEFGVDK